MDLINWWLGWPNWVRDISLVLLLPVFLSHAPMAYRRQSWMQSAPGRAGWRHAKGG